MIFSNDGHKNYISNAVNKTINVAETSSNFVDYDVYNRQIEINSDWLYHSFYIENLNSIMNEGILCPKLLKQKTGGYNEPYYISLSSRKTIGEGRSAYYLFTKYNFPMFIIDGVRAYKTIDSYLSNLFKKTPIPIRGSAYNDEMQAFYRINVDKIKAIKINNYEENIIRIKQILNILEENNKDIPIYDYIDEEKNIAYEIDKEKVLSLTK